MQVMAQLLPLSQHRRRQNLYTGLLRSSAMLDYPQQNKRLCSCKNELRWGFWGENLPLRTTYTTKSLILAPFSEVTLCKVSPSWSLSYQATAVPTQVSHCLSASMIAACYSVSFFPSHCVSKKNRGEKKQLFVVWQPPAVKLWANRTGCLVFFVCVGDNRGVVSQRKAVVCWGTHFCPSDVCWCTCV